MLLAGSAAWPAGATGPSRDAPSGTLAQGPGEGGAQPLCDETLASDTGSPVVCTHVDDDPAADPPGGQGHLTTSSASTEVAHGELSWQLPDDDAVARPEWHVLCEGNGSDGKRLRLFYFRASDQPALDDARRAVLAQVAEEVDRTFFLSAEARGEGRRLRWLTSPPTGGACTPLVTEVVGEPGMTFGAPGGLQTLTRAGVSGEESFLDVVFIDGDAGGLRGYAESVLDDRPGPDNGSTVGARHAGLYRSGWNQYTAAHEIAHLLGAVQTSAPHSANGGHCNDGHDVLCYHEGSSSTAACPLTPRRAYGYVDCGGDDYYHPSPPAGTYLSEHWNTADSPFLQRVPAVGGRPSTRITSGAQQVVLPYTRLALGAQDSTPAGAFDDPSVRRWASSYGDCVMTPGTASQGEGYCTLVRSGTRPAEPGLHTVQIGHVAVDRLDRDTVASAPVTLHVPDRELPTTLRVEVDRQTARAGDLVRVTATYLGQAPGQASALTPVVGAYVTVRQDGLAADGYALDQRRGVTDQDGRFTATFRVLETSSMVGSVVVDRVWQWATAAASVGVDATTQPAAPRRLAGQSRDRTVVLSWQEPPGGAHPGTDSWEVVAENGTVVARMPAQSRSAELAGLQNGQSYRFAVRAVVAGAAGLASNAVETAPTGPPSPPRSVVAWDHPGELWTSWLPPADDGGGFEMQYQARLEPRGDVIEVVGTEWGSFAGLENGTPYTVSVRARHGSSEWGPWSVPSQPVSPASTPSAPGKVRAVAGDGKATVFWEAPASDGGAPVTGYVVTDVATGGGVAARADATSVTFPSLQNGIAYQFAVHAHNRVGGSPASDPSVPVVPKTGAGVAPAARASDDSCPDARVPDGGFVDVPAGSTHAAAIDCVAWWQVAKGRTATSYAPGEPVTREAMAAFVARAIVRAGGTLPASPPDAFHDDASSVHQHAINQLAAARLVQGTGGSGYSPLLAVSRGQMAKFLAGAAAYVLRAPLPAGADAFADDADSPFEYEINRIAAVGLTGGSADGYYRPEEGVTRGQMASFLTRLLDLYVENGTARPPA